MSKTLVMWKNMDLILVLDECARMTTLEYLVNIIASSESQYLFLFQILDDASFVFKENGNG